MEINMNIGIIVDLGFRARVVAAQPNDGAYYRYNLN